MKAIARNTHSGATREVSVSLRTLERAVWEGIDRCTGPCRCAVEPDGVCSHGWPSRLLATGLI